MKKVTEWSKENQFNSFNSWKGLLYKDYYQAIVDWKYGRRSAPLPPVEASLDLSMYCPAKCSFCNADRYLDKKYKIKQRIIPNDHLFKLIEFLGKWGVRAACLGGGGESTTHPMFAEAIEAIKKNGMDVAVATNGILIGHVNSECIIISDFIDYVDTFDHIEALAKCCRWVGISVDAATRETYKKIKQVDKFSAVKFNIKSLVNETERINSNCEVAFKFLICKDNEHEIYEACKLAKQLGVRDFHARPCDPTHQGSKVRKELWQYDVDKIQKQFDKCRKLEDDKFRVFTIVHKFDENFKPKKDFEQCYAAPLCIQICPNGIYLCPDSRQNDFYRLGHHYPNPEKILKFWGGKKHYDLTFNTGKKNCTSRCTFGVYCKQCQELFISNKDPMCRNFI